MEHMSECIASTSLAYPAYIFRLEMVVPAVTGRDVIPWA
jgi:hypothetical protein